MPTAPRIIALSALAVLSLASAAQAETIYGLAAGGLYRFDHAAPGTNTTINSLISGITGSPRAIDFRPSNGRLYLLSTGGSSADPANLYTVNLNTGAVTGVGSFLLSSVANPISMDFNPVTDQLHITSGASRNHYSVNLSTLAVTTLAQFPVGTNLSDIAFSNNTAGASSTTANVWDYNAIGGNQDGNAGTLNIGTGAVTLLGAPGISNGSSVQGYDISSVTGTAYLTSNLFIAPSTITSISNLYTVNLSTGAATLLGGTGLNLTDIAVAIPEPATLAAVAGLGALALRRRK
jgi:hypothetical protein